MVWAFVPTPVGMLSICGSTLLLSLRLRTRSSLPARWPLYPLLMSHLRPLLRVALYLTRPEAVLAPLPLAVPCPPRNNLLLNLQLFDTMMWSRPPTPLCPPRPPRPPHTRSSPSPSRRRNPCRPIMIRWKRCSQSPLGPACWRTNSEISQSEGLQAHCHIWTRNFFQSTPQRPLRSRPICHRLPVATRLNPKRRSFPA